MGMGMGARGRKSCRDVVSGKYHWPKEKLVGTIKLPRQNTNQTLKNKDETSLSSIKRYKEEKYTK